MSGRNCAQALSVFALMAVVCTSAARAQDLSAPSWRGGPFTTFEQWDFSGGPVGPPDAGYFNPYGVPELSTTGGVTWLANTSSDAAVPPRNDVLKIVAGTAIVENENEPVGNSIFASSKVDTIQMTFFGNTPTLIVESIAGSGDFSVHLDASEIVPLPDGWSHATFHHTLTPTPSFSAERYVIGNAIGETTWLDHIVVDTQAIPEPASLGLLTFSSAALLRRRL